MTAEVREPPADYPWPPDQARLFEHFAARGIARRTLAHRPVFTVEEGQDIKAQLPGLHTKNLFLKSKSGAFALITAWADTQIALNPFSKTLGIGRLSFGSGEAMVERLGVTPGSVTWFALINAAPDTLAAVVLDRALFQEGPDAPVWLHPLRNDASTAVAARDLIAFARSLGHAPLIADFALGRLEPAEGE